ncbi:DUF4390 domain-containing protein [Desulfolithobacter sp.]
MKHLLRTLRMSACFLLIALLFPMSPGARQEAEPEIADIIITTSSSHLLLFATIKNCFTDEMIEGVRNGIPVSFTFMVELEQLRNNWFDTTLADLSVTHTMTFDALKEEYHVQLTEFGNRIEKTRSLREAKQFMTELSGLKVIPLDTLKPDAPYELRIKAKLAEKKLPLGIHYLMPFISLWDFETDWRSIEFRY